MKSFVIKEIKNDLEIISCNFNFDGFCYPLKNSNNLKVKEILIIKPEITMSLIENNFNKKYKKILENYLSALQDDDEDESSGMLNRALDEIARLRNILIKRYHKYLSKSLEEKLLKKIKILENEIRSKIVDLKLIKEMEFGYNNIEEKAKSR